MFRVRVFFFLFLTAPVLAGCAGDTRGYDTSKGQFKVGKPYSVYGVRYIPREQYEYTETGIASWYGPGFDGKRTANGEVFDSDELTAAHKTLQMPCLVRVTNLDNGKAVVVRVNDRGPFKRGRVIDLSKRAAQLLGFIGKGTAKVRLQLLEKESMQLASMARAGQSTKGTENAYNGSGGGYQLAQAGYDPNLTGSVQRPVPVSASHAPMQLYSQQVPGHIRDGAFYPDPVVQQLPVTATRIYIQTGSFASQYHANDQAQKLREFGNVQVYPAMVQGNQFYRVRISASDVASADALLARVVASGNPNAIIVVE